MSLAPPSELESLAPVRPGILLPVGLLAGLLLSLSLDLTAAGLARAPGQPRWIAELLENAEVFGHGMGVTMILIGIFVLDPRQRRTFPLLVASSLGAGLAANVVKLAIQRTRPRDLPSVPESVWATFGSLSAHGSHSFPSAHTATAAGFAVALAAFYPQGRWYFVALAMLVGLQRIFSSAHFPSDVFAGAFVGWMIASACLALGARSRSLESPVSR